MLPVLIASLMLGIVAGSRTLLAPAALYLARGGAAGYVLAVAALLELGLDLSPKTPPRTFAPALVGRVVSGAFVGWMLCVFRGAPPYAGAIAGVIGALAGTYGGKSLRLALIARAGALPAALIEDVAAVLLAVVALIGVSPATR